LAAPGKLRLMAFGDRADMDKFIDYGLERLIETYHKLQINKPLAVTFDYQRFVDPASNRDRGPVSIFALRVGLHL
jgi:high affinity Mn2+ porin